jgi:hypothetical protein
MAPHQERIAVLSQQALARIRSAWQSYASGRMVPVALSVAAAYSAGAHVGFLLRFPGSPLSIIWPPNAILLAALLLVPPRQWWAVLLAVLPAHVLVEAQNGVPPWTLLGSPSLCMPASLARAAAHTQGRLQNRCLLSREVKVCRNGHSDVADTGSRSRTWRLPWCVG